MPALYNKTPLLPKNLSGGDGPTFLFKYENMQPGGSFKIRGVSHLIEKRVEQIKSEGKKPPHVFSSSGGNAGLAAATACHILSIPCTVVVPTLTKPRMVEKIRKANAEVIVKGSNWKEADDYLRGTVIASNNAVQPIYVNPFDDPLLWEGHSTMIDEILNALNQENIKLDAVKGIVCSVGGGGLFNGIVHGLENHQLACTIPVVAVETKGCDVLGLSLAAEKPVRLNKIDSIATSLGSSYVSCQAFDNAVKFKSRSVVLHDSDVLNTCYRYLDDFNAIVEPACGATIHTAYHYKILEKALGQKLTPSDIIIIIVCGGSCVTIQDLENAKRKLDTD
ncbi:serine/threonine dehydratase family protein KNAG_0D05380 [Huiozyma naganishii CBS 8797]|uniref:L-serine ammonia-lyase n=1 Tax=Huiozyma naganishii (strain ATCC MYA-139 / BCRC 22969 / CBS 8797 / KCTC 17520 / NBRC 10181 / NCYC 3082 / Yp74L-3) TaxID=1071383 RepID=J7S7E1_HUIN7|nr:hypothetical protein KNAG_0D05380 [Kazachstania naganishii CBS 8797]CCK70276.1 hypothetical protein KNAG_0D05380 [Kazachstania naganishii CBS 8797]